MHEALGTVRVMRAGGCIREIVGIAASLRWQHNRNPRDVYEHHLPALQVLMRRGVGKQPKARPSYVNQGEQSASLTSANSPCRAY